MTITMKMSVSQLPTLTFLFFFAIFSLFNLSCCVKICPEIEKQSLLTFKQSLQDPYNNLSSWNAEVNCCKWKGVFCSNLTGHVHQLHLQHTALSGKISSSLLNLKHLKHLDISENQFNETTIPSFIGSLTNLEYLNLSFADFQGEIPRTIGNLSNLHTLDLEYASSLGADRFEWLSRLLKLEHLTMNCVNLSKSFDWYQQVINKLPSLVELRLRDCVLNNTDSTPFNNNISTSNLAILDLSSEAIPLENSHMIVPRWIFQLSNLIYLDLSGNWYEGPIPTITNSTKLQHVDLSFNYFNSTIPEWLYSSKDLKFLNLGNNNLQNGISNSIANLTSLNTLDLSRNELSGKIPLGITSLCELQKLNLGWNTLQGEISDLFGNISDCFSVALQSLDLSHNQFSGNIPSNIGNLASIEGLYLQYNKLTGNLPETVGQLSNLSSLFIENNMLEGVVTETHFVHLSRLSYLYASENKLTLKVGPNWISPFNITILKLGSWNLGPQIPPWLDTQKMSIVYLDLSNTGLNDIAPNWFWSVRYLNLSNNQLHGEIPVISDPAQFVFLGSNNFSGQLPRLSASLYSLDLSDNLFSGDLSNFLCNNPTSDAIYVLHLGGNHLSGDLPNCFMNWSSMIMLNLSNNIFSGRIPNSIGLLGNLQSLNLHGNNLSGSIPFSMGNCTQLSMIDLADNNLSGNLPNWNVTRLSSLMILILKSNKLSGEIAAICRLGSLQILDLSNNMFSGMIPSCVNEFTAMTTKRALNTLEYPVFQRRINLLSRNVQNSFLESASIATKGKELTYDLILSLVTSIDISKNNLSGNIPNEITSLVELRTLNLSGNHLTGSIPSTIGNMKQLESLDFSNNSLSGELPNSFADMSTLNYLNVSYNHLTGRIPESTQLRGLNESSFIGNNLCGPPLINSCNIRGGESPGIKEDKPEIEWLYVFISFGYAVGLSAFLTTLYSKRSWREAYFEFIENMWDTAYVHVYIRWRKLKTALRLNT